jgi:hypothetical protein
LASQGRFVMTPGVNGLLRFIVAFRPVIAAAFGALKKSPRTGQRVEDEFEIVGVVADSRYWDLRTPDERMAYVPLEQAIDPITNAAVAVRGPGDVTRLAPSIRAIVT